MTNQLKNKIELYGLAAALHNRGVMSYREIEHATLKCREAGTHLSSYVVDNNIINNDALFELSKEYFQIESISINEVMPKKEIVQKIDDDYLSKHHVYPLDNINGTLILGMTDPHDHHAIAAISTAINCDVHPVLMDEHSLITLIKQRQHANDLQLSAIQIQENIGDYFEKLIAYALQLSATDVHIDTRKRNCHIRLRCDGIMQHSQQLGKDYANRLISHIKLLANLDIAEKRLPQDGRITSHTKQDIHLRVSTCPTIHGEKLVLRILKNHIQDISLEQLGMHENQLPVFKQALHTPQGLILITGPTGSGKTVTLYAALKEINPHQKHILTIEDPVEIEYPDITQVNINNKISFGFVQALRTFLRQDPDVIMIGEIRDTETARMAIHAAQTGHLVLSTLHSNSALDATTRLQSLGISEYLIKQSLRLVVAQRLIRTVCPCCHATKNGCKHCHEGYAGRSGIFSVINYAPTVSHYTFQDAAQAKLQQGITTKAELQRVLGNLDEVTQD